MAVDPVLNVQASESTEIGLVVGDQCHVQRQGMGSDEFVESTLVAITVGSTQRPIGTGCKGLERGDQNVFEQAVQNRLIVCLGLPGAGDPKASSASVMAEITTSPTKHSAKRARTCGGWCFIG